MDKNAAFIGMGMIGAGLAVNAVMHGYQVSTFDLRSADEQRMCVKNILDIFVSNQVCTQEQADTWIASIRFTNRLEEALRDVSFIQESIAERLSLKQETYREIQKICGDKAIIASSTTAMFPSVLSAGALYPERIVVGHPYNPSYLLPLMEVCGGKTASCETVDEVCQIYRSWEKEPVICQKEINGFVVNRLSWAASEAAKECVREGVCSVESIDKAIMYGPGMRMAVTGQMLTMSMGVEGGFRKMAEKYGLEPSEWDEIYAQGVEEEIANRKPETGNNLEDIVSFRDHIFIELLRLQGFFQKNAPMN